MLQNRPKKMALIVAQQIVSDIRSTPIEVGEFLPPERLMMEEYGIGRGTLRESLRYLELQGAISLKPGPGGGPFVEPPSHSGLVNSLSILLELERANYDDVIEVLFSLLITVVSEPDSTPTEDQFEALKSTLHAMRDDEDDDVFTEAHMQFLSLLGQSSRNRLYQHLIRALLGIIKPVISSNKTTQQRQENYELYASVLIALQTNNREEAINATRRLKEHITPNLSAPASNVLQWR